ncbi:hypothetical protein COV17_03525 [Candidatus Woesearchaeota archaeon CG10_big_fil_rev_8_21_14_0_10_36_11]|nr:MAG: hypothetical protein COV17_03525 [Candidatus Woesearchaeota archaeon CG10_big_fil_rev_8_21_14_0_10_36_11]
MIDKTSILHFARNIIDKNPGNVRRAESLVQHLHLSYDIAETVIKNAVRHYPNIPLNLREISAAAGLHDIGRPFQADQTFHELRGARYVEEHGVEEGIAQNDNDNYRLAQMFRPHAFVYEFWHDSACTEKRKEFGPIDPILLLPRTWQEAIVTYADLANKSEERISVQERISGLVKKYTQDPTLAGSGPMGEVTIRAVIAARDRVFSLAQRVEALEAGTLSDREIDRYGFL